MTPPVKFLADSMLGRLSKWLVLLGFDSRCVGRKGESDCALLEMAQAEGRVFLTRDANIPEVRGLTKVVVTPAGFEDQLKFVLASLALKADRGRLFSRCTVCNVELQTLSREDALPRVPPLVAELDTAFFRCPGCGKLYWNGTHTANTVAKLERMGIFG
ncbi:MAG: Mut7-C RNAse domain-containing protein [Elusimicrobia bacterium]|nr:Mut7-C RNAse domain-containing protein [Elusimicrobiota bacterium]